MKSRKILPITLLLAFSAQSLEASEAAAEAAVPAAEVDAPVAQEPAPVAAEATPAVEATAPVAEVAAPVVQEPAAQPAPVASAQPVSALPTEEDINKITSLFNAYEEQTKVIRSLQQLATTETQTISIDSGTVRSLLTLLELHKKEADLIQNLRASLAAIQNLLGSWDGDVAQLVTKAKPAAKSKKPTREVDFQKVKDLTKKK